eukprot:scaffold4110_cov20-Tisochrysis_lutea.AAC.5
MSLKGAPIKVSSWHGVSVTPDCHSALPECMSSRPCVPSQGLHGEGSTKPPLPSSVGSSSNGSSGNPLQDDEEGGEEEEDELEAVMARLAHARPPPE